MLRACASRKCRRAHTLFAGQRERESERGREKEREKERETFCGRN